MGKLYEALWVSQLTSLLKKKKKVESNSLLFVKFKEVKTR